MRDRTENNEELELILHLLDFLSHIYGEDVKHGVGVLIQTLAKDNKEKKGGPGKKLSFALKSH